MAKLFHIICTLPNASSIINGITFVAHELADGAVRTEEAVSKDVAAAFKGIKGYVIEDAKKVEAEIKAIVTGQPAEAVQQESDDEDAGEAPAAETSEAPAADPVKEETTDASAQKTLV